MPSQRKRRTFTPLRVGAGVVALSVLTGAIAVGANIARGAVPSAAGSATTIAPAPTMSAIPLVRRTHHIIAIDQSLSVRRVIGPMKAVVHDYARRYVQQGDRVTLFVFSYDATGAAREVLTFDYGHDGDRAIERLLDDIRIQSAPGVKTITLFRPLRDALDKFLRTEVIDSPTYFIVSDGKSDGPAALRRGEIDYEDISFRSLGRATYAVPNAQGWWVAVGGGQGVDYGPLFAPANSDPTTPVPRAVVDRALPTPALADCVLEPGVNVSAVEPVVLKPDFWPVQGSREVKVRLGLRGECVARRRDLRVFLEGTDQRETELAPLQLILGEEEQVVSVSLVLPVDGEVSEVRRLRVVLTLSEGFNRTVGVVPVAIRRTSWGSEYGWQAGLGGSFGAFGLLGAAIGVVTTKRRRSKRPEYVRVPGGSAVALRRGVTVDVGGEQCGLRLPGAEDNDCVGRLLWSSRQRGIYELQPEDGWSLKINGVEGATEVIAGSSVEAEHSSGRRLAFSLVPGTSRDIGRNIPAATPGIDDMFSNSASGSSESAGGFDF